jgi:predicted nucleic acid-binding protein
VTLRALVDTSVFIAMERRRPMDLPETPAIATVSVITLGELWAGLLSAADDRSRAIRLKTLELALDSPTFVVDLGVANAWADLREILRIRKRRMPINDSWIAATALVHGLPVMTQDDDFSDIPGLDVIRV